MSRPPSPSFVRMLRLHCHACLGKRRFCERWARKGLDLNKANVKETLLRMLAALVVAVAAEPAVSVVEAGKVVNSTLRGSEPRHLASCGVAGRVDCGVCKCTDPVACSWCDGNGGPARITGGSGYAQHLLDNAEKKLYPIWVAAVRRWMWFAPHVFSSIVWWNFSWIQLIKYIRVTAMMGQIITGIGLAPKRLKAPQRFNAQD
ncbi:hypothetical protein AK812_SmicGene8298 [Symbiodinium microadriaticum]|uniref:Uncharacterized protein n=1 Tax=Symbiodinium microadriaticum TaxID=2951 RepID=A0A1Q9EL81_SYMMI|nr:hypothetical protein AK812_SmicGene8298 [Symbiodinium microadriaticum]